MTLPLFSQSWLSVLLFILFALIICIGSVQTFRKHVQRKSDFMLHSLIPLGMAALSFSVIGLIKNYMVSLQHVDAAGEMTKLKLAHAVVHGSLGGAPYVILGLLCLGISYIFMYINQDKTDKSFS